MEYLRQVSAGYEPDYDLIRETAAEVACREARLSNADPGVCTQWPLIRVCVHDVAAGDAADCGQPGSVGKATVPSPQCSATDGGWNAGSNLAVLPTDANTAPRGAYVEVRTCYRFTTLLPLNDFLPFGEIHLQRKAVFTVADY